MPEGLEILVVVMTTAGGIGDDPRIEASRGDEGRTKVRIGLAMVVGMSAAFGDESRNPGCHARRQGRCPAVVSTALPLVGGNGVVGAPEHALLPAPGVAAGIGERSPLLVPVTRQVDPAPAVMPRGRGR